MDLKLKMAIFSKNLHTNVYHQARPITFSNSFAPNSSPFSVHSVAISQWLTMVCKIHLPCVCHTWPGRSHIRTYTPNSGICTYIHNFGHSRHARLIGSPKRWQWQYFTFPQLKTLPTKPNLTSPSATNTSSTSMEATAVEFYTRSCHMSPPRSRDYPPNCHSLHNYQSLSCTECH